MRRRGLITQITILVAVLVTVGLPAHAQTTTETPEPFIPDVPFVDASEELSAIRDQLNAATARALELQQQIVSTQEDMHALDARIAVTAERIAAQRIVVEEAERRLAEAEERLRAHLVQVYKRGTIDPLSLLLSADTLADLISRATMLSRIAEEENRLVSDLNVAAADARYQASALNDLMTQDQTLKRMQEERLVLLAGLLREQQSIVDQLSDQERDALTRARRLNAETRARWRAASIPIGTPIPRATAVVDTNPGVTFLISAYMPQSYRSSGQTFAAVCSWYGPGFNGRGTASGQIFNQDDLTCASRTLPFGTILALTRGGRRVIVYVNDRGPYIAGRDLDLSKAAAEALGFSGVATVQAEIVTVAR